MPSDDPCPYCHGTGRVSDQNPYTYAPDVLMRTCDCVPRDPPEQKISSDDLLYGSIKTRGNER